MLATLLSKTYVYQPVFGHPQYNDKAMRPTTDRLDEIIKIYDSFSAFLGRPLRVLDIGCAEGFVSFSLAARGAKVHGIDSDINKIKVCRYLSHENPTFDVSFTKAEAADFIFSVKDQQYDMVIAMSVLHHVIHSSGISKVVEAVEHLAKTTHIQLYELATKEENMPWCSSLNDDPKFFLSGISFVKELRRFDASHLNNNPRPFVYVSNSYYYKHPNFSFIEKSRFFFNTRAFFPTRRYIYTLNSFIKVYRIDTIHSASNLKSYQSEIRAYKNECLKPYLVPLIDHFKTETDVFIIYKKVDGKSLYDYLREPRTHSEFPLDFIKILNQSLDFLIAIRSCNLFYNDIKSYNTLLTEDGNLVIIDYESCSSEPSDWANPGGYRNVYLAFLTYAYEVYCFSNNLPYKNWESKIQFDSTGSDFWNLFLLTLWQKPLNEWDYSHIKNSLNEPILLDDSVLQLATCNFEESLDLIRRSTF